MRPFRIEELRRAYAVCARRSRYIAHLFDVFDSHDGTGAARWNLGCGEREMLHLGLNFRPESWCWWEDHARLVRCVPEVDGSRLAEVLIRAEQFEAWTLAIKGKR